MSEATSPQPNTISRSELTAYAILLFLALTVGAGMKAIYDWSGADQSRSAPVIGWIALGMLLANLAFGLSLLIANFRDARPTSRTYASRQFSLWQIMVATVLAAMLLSLGLKSPDLAGAVGAIVCVMVIAYTIYRARRRPRPLIPVLALLGCLFAPFAWLLFPEPWRQLDSEFLVAVIGMPMLLPIGLIGSIIQQHPEKLAWLMSLAVGGEYLLGGWLITQGTRRGLFFTSTATMLSIFNSFILHALLRA